jgi:tetratricopeptide (TPR) repeat protein
MRIRSKTWRFAILIFLATIVLAGVALVVVSAVGGWSKVRELNQTSPSYSALELATRAAEQQRSGETLYEQALVKDAKLEYRAQLALVKYRLKKYEEAIASYQELIKAGSNAAFAYNGIGNAYRDWALLEDSNKIFRQNEAEQAYRKAIAADTGYVVGYTNLAILLEDQGKIAEAVNIAKQGLEATKRTELSDLIKRSSLFTMWLFDR